MQAGALATSLTHVMASWEARDSRLLDLPCRTLSSRCHGLGDETKSQLFLRTLWGSRIGP